MIRRLLIALVLVGMSAQAHASSNGILTQGLSSSTTSSPGGSNSLSALTSATGSNTFDNAAFPQTWTWNSLSTQTALSLLTSGSITSGTLLNATATGAGNTGYAGYFSNSATATGYAGYFNGSVGFSNPQQTIAALVGSPPIYGANEGMKCDGRWLNDVTANGGSAVITSASHNFTTADNSKAVSCYIGTSVTTTGNITSGSNIITGLASTTSVALYQSVVGTGIPAGAYVDIIPSTTSVVLQVGVSASATTTGVSLTFVNPVNATISSTAGNAATLALNASTTISGVGRCAYATDDTAALQTSLNAAYSNVTVENSGGGTVVLPVGMCGITGQLSDNSSVRVTGQGTSSDLKWMSALDMTVTAKAMFIGGSSPTGYYNHMEFDHFQIDMDAATQSTGYTVNGKCIYLQGMLDPNIHDLYAHGSPASCLGIDGIVDGNVSNNYIVNPGRLNAGNGAGGAGVGIGVCGGGAASTTRDHINIENNRVINPGRMGIFLENLGCTQGTYYGSSNVTGNWVYMPSQPSSSSQNYAIEDDGLTGVSITGNVVYAPITGFTNFSGIGVSSGTLGNSGGIDGVISGNTINGFTNPIFIGNNTAIQNYTISGNNVFNGSSNGIYLNANNTASTFKNIQITANKIFRNTGSGIKVAGGTVSQLLVASNQIFDNGNANTGGIELASITSGLTISSNQIYDDGASLQKFGLFITSTASNVNIQDNQFYGNTFSQMQVTGQILGIVQNNPGSNVFSVSGSSAGTPVGTGINGTFVAGTSGANTVTVLFNGNANIHSNNGYSCSSPIDLTTTSDTSTWTVLSETTTNCVYSGTAVTSDVMLFEAKPF